MVDWSKIGAGVLDFLDQKDEVAAAEQAALNRAKIARDAAAKLAKDETQEANRRLAAARQVEVYQQRIDTNPMVMREKAKTFYANQEKRKLAKELEKQGLGTPGGNAQAAAAPRLTFATQPTAAVPAPAAAAPKLDGMFAGVAPDVATFVQSIGGTPTSGKRTPADQARLKAQGYTPSPTSSHLEGQAMDFVPPKGADGAAIALAARQAGFLDSYYDPKRGHVHVGKERSQFGVAQSMVAAAPGAVNTGGVAVNNPAMLAGMIRAPQGIPGIDLPGAPQMEAPAELQPHQMLDKAGLLAPLAEAMQPVAPETASRPWDRIQSMLVGAGAAAAGADPSQGLGQFILRAGTGGAKGFQDERQQQRDEDKAYKEQLRQAKTALAKMGFDIDLKNVDISNFNVDRVTTNEQNKKNVKFQNMSATDQRTVQEILANHNITAQNIGMGNDFRRAQDQVMIGGTQANTSAINAATQNQVQANAIATKAAGGAGLEAELDTELTSIGLDTKNTRNPTLMTARSTLLGIKAGRPDAAVSSFAQELLMTPGAVQTILAPTKGGDPESEMVKAKALKEFARAKKPEEAWGTVQALNALMQSNPQVALQIAKDYQGQSPSAALILKYAKVAAQAEAAPAGGQ